MTNELQVFLDATQKCLEQCERMIEAEQEKRKALLGNDGEAVERVTSAQQAAVMQLDNLEKARVQAQRAAGFPEEYRADQVLEAIADGAARARAQALFTGLRQSAQTLRELNQAARDIAQNRLMLFAHMDGKKPVDNRPTYKPGHKTNPFAGGSFEQKI